MILRYSKLKIYRVNVYGSYSTWGSTMLFSGIWFNTSNRRESVSSGYPNTEKYSYREIRRQRSIFDEIRGVWISNETLSWMFDISSQSNQKLRSKRRSKIVKTYANYERVSKLASRLWFSLLYWWVWEGKLEPKKLAF